MNTQLVPIGSLRTHPDNPRRGDVDAIRASIRALGFYGYVIAQQSTRFIIAGNHRWQAAALEGMTTIPAILLDVDDRQARQILLADNRTSDLGEYDQEALTNVLMNLSALDSLDGTGYSTVDMETLMRGLSLPEAEHDPKPEPVKKDAPGLNSPKGRPVEFTEDQRLVVDAAIAQVRRDVEDKTLPEGKAIELVLADFLAGANREENL